MFRNYFKTASRSLMRNKNYTIINISGLAAGIAICLVIFVIIQFEMSFDDFHVQKDRIYRVLTEYHHSDAADIFYGQGVPRPMPAGLKANFPQLEQVTTIYSLNDDQVLVLDENGNAIKKFKEQKGVFFLQPSFFKIFNFPWLSGNPATALRDPNSAVVSKEIAEKYFGDWKSAVGKTIKLNNANVLKITGVLATIPPNTDFQLKIVVALGTGFTASFSKSSDWGSTSADYGCYVMLRPGESATAFNKQLRAFSKKMEPVDDKDSHIIQPLRDVHFDAATGNFSGKKISPQLIRALWMIAAFILLIACVNFINLSTAQAVNRAREIGVRKVLGSNKTQLQMQFIIETMLIVVLSVLIAIGIAWLVLPAINRIVDMPLSMNIIRQPSIFIFLFIITISVTLLAGFYPSLVLSGFNPINALKSKLSAKTKGFSLRKGLVVFQFIIAQALIIGTLIIVRQMDYFTTRPIGFDKDAIVNVPFLNDSVNLSKLDYVKKRLTDINGVQNVSFNSNTPMEDDNDNWTTFTFNHAAKQTDFYAIVKFADDQYLATYKLQLAAGRGLRPSDTVKEFLVDETLVAALGLKHPEDILNKDINMWGMTAPVVGVIKKFNARSFRRDLAPVLITSIKAGYDNTSIKLASKDMIGTMKSVQKVWDDVFPDFVFEYKFLDEKIESFYKQEKELSELYKIFAAIAIFLSCLGLYGLASFMAVQRIKEVGIRKVLGASAFNIIYLFSREFVILIGIAFVIASPIAWYFMHKWLQDYPYRIEMGWWVFIAGGLSSIIIAMATVSFQALKAAHANPVKTLRAE